MKLFSGPVRLASLLLMIVGAGLLALNIFIDGSLNIALPLVFLMLGGMFFILAPAAGQKWPWASLLYVPGSLLLALGLIFLINVLTQDWNSWAYAWLLFVVGIGLGLILANRREFWPPIVTVVGWAMAAVGISFFAIFGAIAGGLFIQVMAPILLILGGLMLRWLRPESIFPEQILKRLNWSPRPPVMEMESKSESIQELLVEPLSAREVEVLKLVDGGLSNQQIAVKLNIASSTVKTHINNIYGKLGVQTRVQAIRRARELGLLVVFTLMAGLILLTGCTEASIPVSDRWANIDGGTIDKAQPGEEFYFNVPVDESMFEPVVIPVQIKVSGNVTSGSIRFELRRPDGQAVWNSGEIGPGDFSIATSHLPDRSVTGTYVLGLVWKANTFAQYNLSWQALRLGPAVLVPGAGMLLVAFGFIAYHSRRRPAWRYFALGALFWVITVALKFIFAIPVNPWVYRLLNVSYTDLFSPGNLAAYIYVGALTGIFEAGIATLILRKIRWGRATWDQALGFGIGFGVVEALLLGFLSLASATAALVSPDSLPVPALGNMAQAGNLLMGLAPVVERFFVIIAHIFSCVLLFYAIAQREMKWAWLAILYKTILDTPAAFAAFWGVTTPSRLWAIEGVIAMVALLGLWGIIQIASRYPRRYPRQEEDPLYPPNQHPLEKKEITTHV